MASAALVLDMAISVVAPAGRPAIFSDWAMAARIWASGPDGGLADGLVEEGRCVVMALGYKQPDAPPPARKI